MISFFAYSQNTIKKLKSKEIIVTDVGKICYSSDEIKQISKAFNINEKQFSTCVYVRNNNKLDYYLINDETFNYSYLEDFLMKNRFSYFKVKIYYESKKINSKDIMIIYKFKDRSIQNVN
jgi:hydroxymethylpyrimidine pyrophosphatase-like HAD family hydrolase